VLDKVTMRRAVLRRADLRGSTLKDAMLDRTSLADAVLARIHAEGATGSIVRAAAVQDVDGELRPLEADSVAGWLRSVGAADVTMLPGP
jgi:uncharacterized protein YjbI with pentapeptide repeats